MRRKNFLTENISYTPEKEKEFLEQAKKDLESVKKVYVKLYSEVMFLGIQDFIDNGEAVTALQNKIEQTERAVGKTRDKYHSVIDLYGNEEESDIIDELDRVTDDIGDVGHKLFKLVTALEEFAEVADSFKDLNLETP